MSSFNSLVQTTTHDATRDIARTPPPFSKLTLGVLYALGIVTPLFWGDVLTAIVCGLIGLHPVVGLAIALATGFCIPFVVKKIRNEQASRIAAEQARRSQR